MCLKYGDFLLFSVFYHIKVNIFGKTRHVKTSHWTWMNIFHYFLTFYRLN